MKQYVVEKDWLEKEGMRAFPDLYEKVYLASEADSCIAELEKALRRCVNAIDLTFDYTSEAYGLPGELLEAGEAARALLPDSASAGRK